MFLVNSKGEWLDSMPPALVNTQAMPGKGAHSGGCRETEEGRPPDCGEDRSALCTIREAPAVPGHGLASGLNTRVTEPASPFQSVCLLLKKQDEADTAPPEFHVHLGQGLVALAEQ